MTKPFLFLVGVVAFLGVGLGLAFIGGLAVGSSRAEATTPVQVAPAFSPGGPPSSGSGQSAAPQQRLPGSASPEEGSAMPGRQFQMPADALPPGDSTAGRGGLMGTITGIDGDTLTIETPQGPVRAVIGGDTAITRVVEGKLEDLEGGVQVSVTVEETEGEELEATSVIIVTEGVDRPFDRGFWGDGGIQ